MTRIELRYAIWLAYNKRCVYTEKLIEDFEDLEIDHILKKSMDKEELERKKIAYGLDESFHVDSIENLIPTFKMYNRLKSNFVFNESSERYFLGIAIARRKMIEEKLAEVCRKRETREKALFGKGRQITESGDSVLMNHYFYSNTLVVLSGYLPSQKSEIGSCAIEFSEMGTMISLSHELIITLVEQRRYRVLEDCISMYRNDEKNVAFVIIGTSSLHLKMPVYDQLLIILDDFLNEYDIFFKRVLSFLGLDGFEMLEAKGEYILTNVFETEWEYLIGYSKTHDLDQAVEGEPKFNYNGESLIALHKETPVMVFKITHQIRSVDSNLRRILLIWHTPKDRDRMYIESGEVWTAHKTHEWLRNILSKMRSDIAETSNPTAKNGRISLWDRFRSTLRSNDGG